MPVLHFIRAGASLAASGAIALAIALAGAGTAFVAVAPRTAHAQATPRPSQDSLEHGAAHDAHDASLTSHLAALGVGMVGAATGGQIIGSPTKWSRTWGGYGKRLGDQLGFTAVEEGVQFVVGRSLPWKDDRSPCGSGIRRAIGCGITKTFTLRTVDGRARPDLPFIAGVLAGTSASLIWRPEAARAPKARGFFATRVGIVMGGAAAKRAYAEWKASR